MEPRYRDRRKIDPTRGDRLGDGSPNDNDRVEIGPTQLAFGEWQAAGLTLPNLTAMREFRWKRLTQHIVDRDYGALCQPRLRGRAARGKHQTWRRVD